MTFSVFAETIMLQKYAHDLAEGKETWEQVAHRVASTVLGSVKAPKKLIKAVEQSIVDRKFLPGGRYLYATGRPFHQVQNCLLLRAEDSREGWADLMQKATLALMTGAGIGVDYSLVRPEGEPIKGTGGVATGPLSLMKMVNEAGRGIRQGGSRRSAIWAGLSWKHKDIFKFIESKNWSPEVRKLKETDFTFPADLDGTNISVLLDDAFFTAYAAGDTHAHAVYWATLRQALKTSEPGFSIDTGKNKGETLRNACVTGDTEILTRQGYKRIDSLVGQETQVWNGHEWSTVTPKVTGYNQEVVKITLSSGQSLTCTRDHKFHLQRATSRKPKIEILEASNLKVKDKLIQFKRPVVRGGVHIAKAKAYTQGFISGDGSDGYKFFDVFGAKHPCMEYMSGSIGSYYTDRNATRFKPDFVPELKRFVPFDWSFSSRLAWLAGLLDSDGSVYDEGGVRISSTDQGFLLDVQKMLDSMGVPSKVAVSALADFHPFPGALRWCRTCYVISFTSTRVQWLVGEGLETHRLVLNHTPNRDCTRFVTVTSVEDAGVADTVYCFNEPLRHMGVFNGILTGQCTEITSADDSDICNLGSINLARVDSLEEMKQLVETSTAFLMAGTRYSSVPYAKVDEIRTKNRRLGLGLMGFHEWLLKRGKKYGPDDELEEYLKVYETSSEVANRIADEWGVSRPVKTRAIAPTGTIGILGETTTGIEPLFCVAYKRRYLKGDVFHYQYVIDPIAKRLIESGVSPEAIEDAYSLAADPERRVAFQAWVQQYVDHAISSTLNLPAWGSELNNADRVRAFGDMLMKYLPKLRGMTCYADGSRGGQPLSAVKFSTAIKHEGEIFMESGDVCSLRGGASCGG